MSANDGVLPLPVRALWCDPKRLSSADGAHCCHCDDGADYVVKDGSSNPRTPHNEWFCNSLGERVGIACPSFRQVDIGGDLAFGSRWESEGRPKTKWYELVQQGVIPFDQMSECFSRLFAFDHFVHNTDRHGGNYVYREQYSTWLLMPIDYSRAWLYHKWPLPDLPFASNVNTLTCRRQMTAFLGNDLVQSSICSETLARLRQMKSAEIGTIINAHPQSWLTEPEKDAIIAWWDSAGRTDRIDVINDGISHGKFV